MTKEKQIQIPKTLFVELVQYFMGGHEDLHDHITKELDEKLVRQIDHDIYTQSKIAPTSEAREKARQEYLDRKGIHPSFRW